MAIVLEAPEQLELTRPAALYVEPPAALAAANLLNGEAADNEPQRAGSTSVTIRLVKAVDDPVAAFAGHVGDVFDGYIDGDGGTWIPLSTGDIMLEPEEFEIVEPLGDREETALTADQATAVPQPDAELQSPVTSTPTTAATTATPPPPRTHEDAEARRRSYLREKDVLQEQISALAIEQVKLKEQIKLCKKESEVLVERLNNLIEDWEHPAPLALENEPTTPASSTMAKASLDAGKNGGAADDDAAPAAGPAVAAVAVSTDAQYRAALESAALDRLGLPTRLVQKLADADCRTIWDLEQLRSEISQGRKKWPKGIGEAKQTQIEDAVLKWVAANQANWEQPQAEPAEQQPAAAVSVPADIDDL